MKKIFSLLLSLCLLVSASALADSTLTANGQTGTTSVTYEVAVKSYTVTIPASATIDSTSGTGTMTVSLNATDYNPAKATQITVELTASANYKSRQLYLSDGTNTIPYTIVKGSTNIIPSGTLSECGVISWTTRDTTKTATASLTLTADAAAVATAGAGNYSDTLTFKVSTMELEENQTPII